MIFKVIKSVFHMNDQNGLEWEMIWHNAHILPIKFYSILVFYSVIILQPSDSTITVCSA
jgi:hypothetical protein